MGGGHLGVDVLACLEGLGGHAPLPLGPDYEGDRVDVRVGEHVLVLGVGGHAGAVLELGAPALVQGRNEVANGGDAEARDGLYQPQPTEPTMAQPEESYANVVHAACLLALVPMEEPFRRASAGADAHCDAWQRRWQPAWTIGRRRPSVAAGELNAGGRRYDGRDGQRLGGRQWQPVP